MRQALVTGAGGFVGQALCRRLISDGWHVRGTVRTASGNGPEGIEIVPVDDLARFSEWPSVLSGIDVIVHLAARVHMTRERASDPLAAFRRVNVQGTERLAEAAVVAGITRVIYLSTVKVHGEESQRPLTEDDPAAPLDAYGVSKWEAEQALRRITGKTGLDIVTIRPPLVYGPGVKANFLSLLKAVAHGIPLPFGAVDHGRSFVYLGNLVDAIRAAMDNPAAAGQTFMVCDGEDVSVARLIRQIAAAMDVKPRLWPVSANLLKFCGQWSGRSAAMTKIIGSLTVDSRKIRESMQWQPPYTFEEGIRETVKWYKAL